jgi:hypothetical protein
MDGIWTEHGTRNSQTPTDRPYRGLLEKGV